ncbi:protein mono-ADP-ribosyltransferase PARP14 [Molossus molossus]|uniref:Poly [ADP-ribose] polymerase n=1 Tax=Molossus molossus TaxID=27622 RepID=A0A7J8I1V0_MOLMO|nr:protein mono-ADP-ribosyltransferase PARP14 [Molossus molossus]KAF6478261.1 poly(ADP-ribose) polymerase family member 14 [Molossus molossus]
MAEPGYFPLLVEGSWGPDPPKNLNTKLQMYFQSQKRSGGGECEVRPVPGSPARFLVLFHPQDVRQNVLERENHELVWPGKGTFKLTVQSPTPRDEVHDVSKGKIPTKESKTKEHAKEPEPDVSEDAKIPLRERSEKVEDIPKECENIPSLVAFENVTANVTDIMLILLVENISGLFSEDFQVELIRDFEVAIVTFQKHIDTKKFVEDCAMHRSVKQLRLYPRLLEETKAIRVENLPPGVDYYNLKCFFENPQNGGGRLVSIECFPEESSALIEFFDRKVLDTIMTKKLYLNNMPLSVFPYYTSLGTALYGKEQPLIKLPAPFKESLDLFLWKFLHKNNQLIEEINEEVRRCHCELTWSQLSGEVTIRPAATLASQGRQKIKNWKKDVSTAFSDIKSRYKVTPFKVEPIVWDTIKNDLEDERILTEFDTLMGIVTLVGKSEDVQSVEPHVKELIENTIQKIKREEQSLKETVTISPSKYSLLCLSGMQEQLHREYPEVEILYDKATQHMCFKGLDVDVYKVKCEIQEKVYTMVQTSIPLPPEVFQFLQQVDCAEFSKSLFIAQGILAVYELEGTTVLLTGCSSEVLLEAGKHMASALSYKRIDIEDREVLNSKKWKMITRNLPKKHNSSSKTVIINELTSETTAEVIIAGYVREVNEMYNCLFDFVEKNMKIERFIEVKPPLVINYLKAEKKLFLHKIKAKKLNVHVDFNHEKKTKGILLIGSKAEVLEAMNLLKQARDSVCIKSICIDKPGASQFFKDKEWYYKREVRSLGCFVELLQKAEEGGDTDGQTCSCRTELAPGVSLIVQQGDLTQFPVEVVVNSANEDLRLSGGLAAALSKAAGPELQADCDQIVKKKGKIPPGHATISTSGKLPYHQVIHAVGPKWKKEDAQECVVQLKRVVARSLHLAENLQCRSIAIPAIGSGNYGFPLPQCAEAIVLAIKETFQSNWNGNSLKEIYLVDSAEKTVEAFAETVKTVFRNTVTDTASPPSVPAAVQPSLGKDDGNRRMMLCPGGLRILLVKGDVQNVTTDVVVNSIPSDLGLDSGPLSQALLKKAGPNLQKELDIAGQKTTVDVGTILQTSGCNLQCQRVLHVVVPGWNNGNPSSHKIMEDIIRECLEITESLSLKSITFPAIGTGNLGFPKNVFADLIISEVFKFSCNNLPTALQDVCLLLHPSDQRNIQAFSDEFDRRANEHFVSDKIPKAENTQVLYGTVTNPSSGVHEMKIGPITFQVASGDIAKEEADVIVNSTSKTFNLKAGVSKAILEQAGQDVEVECCNLAQQGNNSYIITKGGLLKCKNIIHVIGGNNVKNSVTCVLQECENRNYSTICLPAIGTGSAKQDPDKVAGDIIDAIEDFVQKGSVKTVKKVKVVIFLPQVLDVFCANMKKREGSQPSTSQSVISKIASFFGLSKPSPKKQMVLILEKKTESAIFQVCGENEKCLENALSWLQNLIIKEQNLYISEDECIKDFDEKECQELTKLQKELNISLILDRQKPLIKISGMSRDVEQARNAVEEMLKTVRLAKEQESKAEYISDFIEWQYNDNNAFHNFDKITNLQLEEAKKNQRQTLDVKINNQSYTVDLKTYTATDANRHSLPVRRIMKSEVEIPGHWSDMKQQQVCLVELQRGHAEYNQVADAFNKTCSQFKILKIERIQNPALWKAYQTKKKIMDAKNGQIQNEKLLFHGTDANSLPHVNLHGFNRSYAGKNAVAYGKGTYFAVNANYSANNTYSKPDINGIKHMYYVRVLTGLYECGNQSLIVPPPKNPQHPIDLYDTVTDNVRNPSLFVVFYDYQAYPEYLITFTQ